MTDPGWSDESNTSQVPQPLPAPFVDSGPVGQWAPVPPEPGCYSNHAVGATQWWDGQQWTPPVPPSPQPMGYGPPVNFHVAPPQVVVVAAPKSVGLAFLLAFLFGPLGMLYSTVAGGLIMLVVSFFAFFVSLLTFFVPTFFCLVICIVWSCVAASNSNSKRMVRY